MIIESIILAIFVLSFGGVIYILVKKMPEVSLLPQNQGVGIREHKIFLGFENRLKGFINFFQKQIFFHKLLSWVKVITLKIEVRVDKMLHKIRKKNTPV